jgi:hypothetical protein
MEQDIQVKSPFSDEEKLCFIILSGWRKMSCVSYEPQVLYERDSPIPGRSLHWRTLDEAFEIAHGKRS